MAARKGIPKIKPRNPVMVPALARKAGKHAPDPKGQRRLDNEAAKVEAEKAIKRRGSD